MTDESEASEVGSEGGERRTDRGGVASATSHEGGPSTPAAAFASRAATGALLGQDPSPRLVGRVPWGVLLVIIAVLAVERLLSAAAPWTWLDARIPEGRRRVEGRIVEQELGLRRLAAIEPERRGVILGSSRGYGFRPEEHDPIGSTAARTDAAAREAASSIDVTFVNLSFPLLSPLSIRGLAERLAPLRPRVVVLVLSEIDTHAPLVVHPQSPFGSPGAAIDIVRLAGPAFAARQRDTLYRLALSGWLGTYRYRGVLQTAGLDGLRRFPLGRLRPRSADWPMTVLLSGDAPVVKRHLLARIAEDLARAMPEPVPGAVAGLGFELVTVAQTSRGPHVAVQLGLLERAIEILRASGAEVVIVEAPLHPAATVYDPALRGEFLAFTDLMRERHGVHVIPLEELAATGPFTADDFSDVLHLTDAGAGKLTDAALGRMRTLLPARRGAAATPHAAGQHAPDVDLPS